MTRESTMALTASSISASSITIAVLYPQFQAHFGDVFRRSRHNLFTCRDAACHTDHCNLWVTRQFLPNVFTTPEYKVKHAARKAYFINDFGECNRIVWRKFTGFNDDGITGQRAGAILRAMRKNGKFHGRMPVVTPSARLNRRIFSPGRSL